MKVAIITDIHFDCRGGSKFWIEQQEKFFSKVFFPSILENGVDTLFILGDTWEYRYKLGVNSMNAAFRMFFDKLEEYGIQTHIIYGNHDVAFRNTNTVNSIDFLGKMYQNLTVHPEPVELTFGSMCIGLVPWITKDNREQCMDFIRDTRATVIGGHFEIDGFEMTPGHECVGGLEYSIFDRFDLVLSGHFHTVSQRGNVHYISNSFWTSWGDYGEKKGFRILDTETLEMEFIQNPFEVYSKLKYEDNLSLAELDYSEFQGKYVKVFVDGFHSVNQNKFDIFMENMGKVAESVEAVELNKMKMSPSIDPGTEDLAELSLDNRTMVERYLVDVTATNNKDHQSVSKLFFAILDEARASMESE